MSTNSLEKQFEHNNWANRLILAACAGLSEAQLDAAPASATEGSIRQTLTHLVAAQQNYLRLLTLPLEERRERLPEPAFADLERLANSSGEALVRLVQDEEALSRLDRIRTRDSYLVEPWVILVQVINHADEHREQVKSMLTALGHAPPSIDGWDFGEATGAMLPAGNE